MGKTVPAPASESFGEAHIARYQRVPYTRLLGLRGLASRFIRMRNSEARRYARWSAGVAMLLAIVVAGVYLRGVWVAKQAERRAPPAVPAAIEQRSNEFSYSKVEGQRTIY